MITLTKIDIKKYFLNGNRMSKEGFDHFKKEKIFKKIYTVKIDCKVLKPRHVVSLSKLRFPYYLDNKIFATPDSEIYAKVELLGFDNFCYEENIYSETKESDIYTNPKN